MFTLETQRHTDTNTHPHTHLHVQERTHSPLHTQTPDYKDTHTQILLPDKHPQTWSHTRARRRPPGLPNGGDLGTGEQVSHASPHFPGVSPPPPAAPHPMTGTNNESASHRVTQIPGRRGPTQAAAAQASLSTPARSQAATTPPLSRDRLLGALGRGRGSHLESLSPLGGNLSSPLQAEEGWSMGRVSSSVVF